MFPFLVFNNSYVTDRSSDREKEREKREKERKKREKEQKKGDISKTVHPWCIR